MLPLEAAIGVDDQLASFNYTALNKQFINGQWVDGHEDATVDNLNPFTDDVIHTLRSAGTADVDTAFAAAKRAAPNWASTNPLIRRDILLKAATILKDRQEEFIGWLTQETGSTYIKGLIEVQWTCYI